MFLHCYNKLLLCKVLFVKKRCWNAQEFSSSHCATDAHAVGGGGGGGGGGKSP